MRKPLSGRQTAAVVLLVLAGLGALYGLGRGVAALWHRRSLEASIPATLAGARQRRDELVGLIESYKAQFGYYPPMFTSAGPTRGVVNPLCYELLGVRYNTNTAQFYIPITKDGLARDEVQKYFNSTGFSNCLIFPSFPTNFLANRGLSVGPMTTEAELLGLGLSYTEIIPEPLWDDYNLTPWRYTTNPAEHNPGKFDLWIEVRTAGKRFEIGNWPEVK